MWAFYHAVFNYLSIFTCNQKQLVSWILEYANTLSVQDMSSVASPLNGMLLSIILGGALIMYISIKVPRGVFKLGLWFGLLELLKLQVGVNI